MSIELNNWRPKSQLPNDKSKWTITHLMHYIFTRQHNVEVDGSTVIKTERTQVIADSDYIAIQLYCEDHNLTNNDYTNLDITFEKERIYVPNQQLHIPNTKSKLSLYAIGVKDTSINDNHEFIVFTKAFTENQAKFLMSSALSKNSKNLPKDYNVIDFNQLFNYQSSDPNNPYHVRFEKVATIDDVKPRKAEIVSFNKPTNTHSMNILFVKEQDINRTFEDYAEEWCLKIE